MSDTASITYGLNKHLGTVTGFVRCSARIDHIDRMLDDPKYTIDEKNVLLLELAKLYSWQARNLRAQVTANRKER